MAERSSSISVMSSSTPDFTRIETSRLSNSACTFRYLSCSPFHVTGAVRISLLFAHSAAVSKRVRTSPRHATCAFTAATSRTMTRSSAGVNFALRVCGVVNCRISGLNGSAMVPLAQLLLGKLPAKCVSTVLYGTIQKWLAGSLMAIQCTAITDATRAQLYLVMNEM